MLRCALKRRVQYTPQAVGCQRRKTFVSVCRKDTRVKAARVTPIVPLKMGTRVWFWKTWNARVTMTNCPETDEWWLRQENPVTMVQSREIRVETEEQLMTSGLRIVC
jgi:hypothetical protein